MTTKHKAPSKIANQGRKAATTRTTTAMASQHNGQHNNRDSRGRKSKVRPDVYMSALAIEVGISAGYLSKLFRGTRTPSLPVAQRLAKCMHLSLQQLLDSLPQALPREE